MATITGIKVQKRHPGRVDVDLDGEFAFGLAGSLAGGLQVGQKIDSADIDALRAKDAEETAYQRALRLLSLRERSETELRRYLQKLKTPADALDRTIARLRQNRHADDARFARLWVENRAAFRPRGIRALTWELRRKGVDPDLAGTAVAGLDEAALAQQAGLKKAAQLNTADWPNFRTKVSAYLARRGFPSSIISETVSGLWTETHAGQPSFHEEDLP